MWLLYDYHNNEFLDDRISVRSISDQSSRIGEANSVVRRDASSLSSTQQITSVNHDFVTIEKSVDFATGFCENCYKEV